MYGRFRALIGTSVHLDVVCPVQLDSFSEKVVMIEFVVAVFEDGLIG